MAPYVPFCKPPERTTQRCVQLLKEQTTAKHVEMAKLRRWAAEAAHSLGFAVLGASIAFGLSEKLAHALVCFLTALVLLCVGWLMEGTE